MNNELNSAGGIEKAKAAILDEFLIKHSVGGFERSDLMEAYLLAMEDCIDIIQEVFGNEKDTVQVGGKEIGR